MADEITVIEQPVSSLFGTEVVPEHIQPAQTIINNPLENVAPANAEVVTNAKIESPAPAADATVPTVDYNTYLKTEFGFDSAEVAKEQIAKWKEMKPYEEPKFVNDESKLLFEAIKEGKKPEVLRMLAKQEALENLTSSEVTETNAPDIIKLAMMQKYPTLTKEQIDYKFTKDFATPAKPSQSPDELDEDFQQRTEMWQRQVNDKKQDLLIEANISKPELEKAKAELKLEGVFGNKEAVVQRTPQEMEAAKTIVDSYINQLGSAIKEFKGVELTAKNGEVEIPLAYTSSETERAEMQTILTAAIQDSDVNPLFAKRWFSEDGKPNVTQMTKDINWMFNGEKIAQKMANESASQRMEIALKEKSNIQLINTPQGTFVPQKTEQPNMVAGTKIPEIMLW